MTHADEMRQVAALEKIAEMTGVIGTSQSEELQSVCEEIKAAAQAIVKSLKESALSGSAAERVTKKVIMQGERN